MRITARIVALAAAALLGSTCAQAQVTYTITPGTQLLPDNGCTVDGVGGNGAGGVTNTISVTDSGTITDVNFRVGITHTWRGDIQMAITYTPMAGAESARVIVINAHGNDPNSDNYFATLDQDTANGLCSVGANCGTGNAVCAAAPGPTCQPDNTIDGAAFVGATAPGVFTFYTCDRASQDVGTIDSLSAIVSGVGGAPGVLSISPTTVPFGNQQVGTTSAAQTVTLSNTGASPLTVSTLTAAAAPFTLSGGTCSPVPITIANGASCTLTYTFSPTVAGAANQTLTVDAGAAGNGTIGLSGTGTTAPPGVLTINPASLNFGTVAVGATSAAQTVTLGNTGPSPLTVTTLTAAAAPFAATGGSCTPVPITIANGASCTLTYTFTPAASGAANQTLTVDAGAAGNGTIGLSGTGGSGVVGVLNATVSFGNQTVGGVSQQALTITNTGSGPISVTGLSAVAAPFSQIAGGTCGKVPFTVAAGGSCTVLYRFSPTAGGTFTQPVTVTADVGTAAATLTGTGVVAIPLPVGGWSTWLLLALVGVGAGWTLLRRQ